MQLSDELMYTLSRYENCREYSDSGEVSQRFQLHSGFSMSSNCSFSTKFVRGEGVRVICKNQEAKGTTFDPSSQSFAFDAVSRFSFYYDWNIAKIEYEVINSKDEISTELDLEGALKTLNAASLGYARLVLESLLKTELNRTCSSFADYKMVREEPDATSIKFSAKHESRPETLEIWIDNSTRLLNKVKKCRTRTARDDFELFNRVSTILEQSPDSELLETHEFAREIRSKNSQDYAVENIYVFDDVDCC